MRLLHVPSTHDVTWTCFVVAGLLGSYNRHILPNSLLMWLIPLPKEVNEFPLMSSVVHLLRVTSMNDMFIGCLWLIG